VALGIQHTALQARLQGRSRIPLHLLHACQMVWLVTSVSTKSLNWSGLPGSTSRRINQDKGKIPKCGGSQLGWCLCCCCFCACAQAAGCRAGAMPQHMCRRGTVASSSLRRRSVGKAGAARRERARQRSAEPWTRRHFAKSRLPRPFQETTQSRGAGGTGADC
jgi:hypothetical protein